MRVKICGLTNAVDARAAVQAGADALGFVMGGSVLPIEIEPAAQHVRAVVAELNRSVETFLVTHLLDGREILALADYVGTSGIQISEYIPLTEMKYVRGRTDRHIIKTVVTSDDDFLEALDAYSGLADSILTDSRRAGYVGGTGQPNDWQRCRAVVDRSPIPVWVAGGLTLDNMTTAATVARPWGLDVSTGVSCFGPLFPRKDRKDPAKIGQFVTIARGL